MNDDELNNIIKMIEQLMKESLSEGLFFISAPELERQAVNAELERLDRLEEVVKIRDTAWVADYCRDLMKKEQ